MKDTKFSMKKKLFASTSMLVVSAVMLSTATYAWFTMSKEVTVTGMELKAKTESGLVISGDAKTTWKTDWDVEMPQGVALFPTSTNGTAAGPQWVAATSKYFDDADKNQTGSGSTYSDLNLSYVTTSGTVFGTGEGIGRTTASGTNNDYVLKKTFYIKSTGEAALAKTLQVDEVTAEVVGTQGGSGAANLDKSLRVLVVVNDTNSFIYAPITGYDPAINYKGTTTLTLIASSSASRTTVNPIPNVDDNAVKVDMYMYFEGEDENCKSSNITAISVDTLMVSAKFSAAD
jgi:hypothetical protein